MVEPAQNNFEMCFGDSVNEVEHINSESITLEFEEIHEKNNTEPNETNYNYQDINIGKKFGDTDVGGVEEEAGEIRKQILVKSKVNGAIIRKCTYCNKTLSTKGHLAFHVKTVHHGHTVYCQECNKYISPFNLIRHRKEKHEKVGNPVLSVKKNFQ